MASKSLAAKGDVQREAQKLHEYGQPWRKPAPAAGSCSMHFLGGSVASALVNLTQPMLQTAPYTHAVRWLAHRRVMARRAIWLPAATRQPGQRAAAERAAAEGITEPHEVHQLMADASGSSFGSNPPGAPR